MVESKYIWSDQNHVRPTKTVLVAQKDKALHTFSDVMDSKMKALQWEKLTAEFYAYIGDQNMVSKAQLVRKWHNWKQYNKGVSIEFIPT